MTSVSNGKVGGSGLKRQVWKDAGARRGRTTKAVRGWSWLQREHKSLRSRQVLCGKPEGR